MPRKSRVHILGITGSGASAAACIAQAQGFEVDGCDNDLESEFTEELEGIEVLKGHSPEHLQGVEILAVTPAVLSLDPDNPEIVEARARGIKVMTWQQFMGKFLCKDKFVIAVCGTHGKSTTTGMIAKMLEDARLDPTVFLGALLPSTGKNFRVGESKYFIVEADEYNDNFYAYTPDIAVITNIEFDHPEYFSDFKSYKASFQNFLGKAKQAIFANFEDPGTNETLNIEGVKFGSYFKPISDYSKNLIDFELSVIGAHNKMNASAAYNVGLNIGIDVSKIEQSLKSFKGVGRRAELIGEKNGAKIYSDFGHHPTELKVTVEEFKKHFPDKKLWLIYQPHMFTRTKALFEDFVKVFKEIKADGTFIIDIYPSREKDTGIVSSKELVEAVGKDNVRYFKSLEEAFAGMKGCIQPDGVLLFMGAGDIDRKIRKLINE